MKIASIKEIKNVGTFANFANGGSIRFEALTFIYGFNTYGKTTLTDIFQSLKDNNPQILLDRKTIPVQTEQQRITISVKDVSESDLKFENSQWQTNQLSPHIEVFGAEFIHKNVFTGFNVERANKEQFTQFILGEQGVNLATEIKENRQLQSDKNKELKQLVPSHVKDKPDSEINSFINYKITGLDAITLDKDLINKKNELAALNKSIKDPQTILNIENHETYKVPEIDIISILNSFNNLLKLEYSDMEASVLEQITQHIAENHKEDLNSEKWLQQGLEFCTDKQNGQCPFCGQSLHDAQGLLNLYSLYFQQGYNDYITKLESQLKNKENLISQESFANKTQLQTFYTTLSKYEKILNDVEFSNKLKELLLGIESIQEDEISLGLSQIHEKVKSSITEKMKYPFKKLICIVSDP